MHQRPDAAPVLAVLPFRTLGEDEEDARLAQGLFEDVCGELTRFRAFHVISPVSAAAVAELSDREVGERLGASHVLRGRLRRAGPSLELSADLIACADARQLWSERVGGAAEELFDLESELVGRIAATLHARLEESSLAEVRRRPTESLAAHGLTLEGLALLRQGTLAADEEARARFARALELDPLYPRAHGGMALSWFNEWSCQFWDRFGECSRRAYSNAHRALELDDRDAMLHLVVGRVLIYRRDFERGAWYLDRALALCPNDAELLIQVSLCETYLGRPALAIEHAARAMRLNPYHPNYYHGFASMGHLLAREPRTALAMAARAGDMPFVDSPAYSAIALAHLGRLSEGRARLALYHEEFRRKIVPGRAPEVGEAVRWLLDINPFQRREDVEYLLEGFHLLGEPCEPPAAQRAPALSETPARDAAALVRMGQGWIADFGARRAILPDLKGLHDIHRLLERPGDEMHCLDLSERGGESAGGDAVLDRRARTELEARIRELSAELEDAQDCNDSGREERAQLELDRLVAELSRALGLGARSRRLGDASERARSAITWRIRHALKKVEAAHPELGRHLANSLRTGVFCSYQPERPIRWSLALDSLPRS